METEQPDERRLGLTPFAAYLGGMATWFVNLGLQFVIIPTVVAVYLKAGAAELAFSQIMLALPQLLLLIYAGAIADRSDGRRVLIAVHTLASIPPMLLGWLLWNGDLTYIHVVIYAGVMGALSAFGLPARDALLLRVTGHDVQRAVSTSLIAQFAAQIVGFTLAGLAAPITGPWVLPVMQCLALAVGLGFAFALPTLPAIDKKAVPQTRAAADRGWRTGLHIVIHSPRLYPVMLSTISVGIFFIGPFMVGLPLIVRDNFDGGQLEISLLSLFFWGGTIITTIFLMYRAPIEMRGRAMIAAVFIGCLSLLGIAYAPSFPLVCMLAMMWGLAAGVNMTMSRTIAQIESPVHARARVLAIYNLGFMGAAPAGATLTGFLTELLGVEHATALSVGFMLIFSVWLCLRTPILRVKRHARESRQRD